MSTLTHQPVGFAPHRVAAWMADAAAVPGMGSSTTRLMES